mgnify:FL=1
MGFCEMVEILQRRNKNKIVICKNGNFYTAIGKDAIALNKLLGLKLTCMGPELCKVGFPVNAFEKYTTLLMEKRYSYIIYEFYNKEEKLIIAQNYQGKHTNTELARNQCYMCENNIYKNKKMDKYMKAIIKLYEEEDKEERQIEIEEYAKQKRKKTIIWKNIKKKKTD